MVGSIREGFLEQVPSKLSERACGYWEGVLGQDESGEDWWDQTQKGRLTYNT